MAKISVIVPVYNAEKYLKRCINSILSQIYENLEIILVDDGSTDNSGLICDQYEMIDARVKVIHKKNAGVGAARNSGLEIASAVIGAEKEFPLIGEFLEFYSGKNFLLEDGSINNVANVIMMTEICQKYGLKPDNTYQVIRDMHIFPKTYFCPLDFWKNRDFTENTYTIHYFDASWLDENTKKRIVQERKLVNKLKNKILIRSAKIFHSIRRKK